MHYSFPRRGLTFQQDSTGYRGAGDLTVFVKQGDSLAYADRWLVPHLMHDTVERDAGSNLVGNYGFQLAAGDYVAKVLLRDRFGPGRADSVSVRLPVRLFGTEKPVLSDLEFAVTIRQGTEGGPFYKNTLDVIPNVGSIFMESQKCFYYTEAYNLLAGEDRSDFTVRASVFDAVGREIMGRERIKKRAGESSVLVDQFAVDKMRSGTYMLVLSLLDTVKKVVCTTGKKFYVYNSVLGVDSSLLSSAGMLPLIAYMSMEESELDREFRWIKYEASDGERSQYAQLKGVDAKRKFLSDFWRRRVPGMRDEYLGRVAYTNTTFPMSPREGYRTDRGRVYIMYGVPDEVERHPSETDSRPYEIWSYHSIQGGVIFAFVQRNTTGDYELVHSTHRNEIRDDNWQERAGISR
jgi:GWxTD domain-containing protein